MRENSEKYRNEREHDIEKMRNQNELKIFIHGECIYGVTRNPK
jgi:hypothetical protein